jgi:hypothetical protein
MYTSIMLLSHLDDSLEPPDRAGVIGVYIEVTKTIAYGTSIYCHV